MRSSIARLSLAALTVLPLAASQTSHALGPELAPNPGFEQSPTDPTGDTSKQPLLPTGWIFEGSAGLFDHSENGFHTGKRMAAISIPASTPRLLCPAGCVPNPSNEVKDATAKYYSVTPYWRTQNAVTVTPGTVYRFQVWTAMDLATVDVGGAVTKIRWLDSSGMPLSETAGPKNIQEASDPPQTLWELITKNVTAPAGATRAIIMLGAADDLFITQVKYDDVSFRVA
jgi:hypothetical protein